MQESANRVVRVGSSEHSAIRRRPLSRTRLTPELVPVRILQPRIRLRGINASDLVSEHLTQRRQRVRRNVRLGFPETRPNECLAAVKPGLLNRHDQATSRILSLDGERG